MLDPFVGWLSYVDQLLSLVAHIFANLAKIFGSAVIMLGSVLSARNCLWKFRREAVMPITPRKRVSKRQAEKGSQGSGAPP